MTVQLPSQESLLSALAERYTSIHNIRERIQSLSLWLLGILLSISGRLAQGSIHFHCNEKFVIILFVAILIVIFFKYFENLKKGMSIQRKVAAKIEDSLGFYEGDSSIYPKDRKTKTDTRPFLDLNYMLLGFGFFTLIVSVLYFT